MGGTKGVGGSRTLQLYPSTKSWFYRHVKCSSEGAVESVARFQKTTEARPSEDVL